MPPIRYCAEVVNSGAVLIEVMETYRKQTIRNHCAVYGPNGMQILTVPVSKPNGNHTLTRDIRIADHSSWQRTHWRSILTAYNNSPFFLYYQDDIHPFFEKKYQFLTDFNLELLHTILRILKVKPSVRFTSVYEKNPENVRDLRNRITDTPGHSFSGSWTYTQVFEPSHGFLPDLSILDLICNLGPEAGNYLSFLLSDPSDSALSG